MNQEYPAAAVVVGEAGPPPLSSGAGASRATLVARVAVVVAALVVVLEALSSSSLKSFSLDEFEYAHAAFLVAKGLVPYRDFVEVHFPFLFQLLAPVSALYGTDPTQITALRAAMLVPLAASAVATWMLLRRHGAFVAMLGPVLLLSTGPLLRFLIEIRGDGLAFALVISSMALVQDRAGPIRSLVAGLLLGLACWTSQKVFVYGAVFPLVLFIQQAGGAVPAIFGGSVRHFVAGAVAVAGVVAGWLTVTGSWGPAWHWCFGHFEALQAWSTIFPWTQSAAEVFVDTWHILAFGAAGVLVIARDEAASSGERLIVAVWPLTFVSIAIQFAPYAYSYIPFLGVSCLLAARAAIHCIGWVRTTPGSSLLPATLLVTLLVASNHSRSGFQRFVDKNDNAYQLAVLRTIDELVAPKDTIYDNTGSFVARQSLHPKFFTDVFMRLGQAAQLENEILPALVARPPAMVIVDLRFEQLPEAIKRFVAEHYLPYSGELLLPGHHLTTSPGEPFSSTFPIVRGGSYVVEGATPDSLKIDGKPVVGEIILTGGEHRIEGLATGEAVFITVVPANRERWRPRFDMQPRFTRLF